MTDEATASTTAASSAAWPFCTHSESAVTVRFSSTETGVVAPPRFAVGYWSIRGLAAPIRMMLCAAQQDHVVYLYDCLEKGNNSDNNKDDDDSPEWMVSYLATEKVRLRDTYQNPFMNLPYVVDQQHELLVTQSNACLQYVGDCVNMMGTSPQQRALGAQILCELYDLRNVMVGYAYAQQPTEPAAAAAAVASARSHWAKLEQHFKKNAPQSSSFLVGDTFTAPDFALFEMVDQFDQLCRCKELPDCLADFPHVRAFQTAFGKLPYVQQRV